MGTAHMPTRRCLSWLTCGDIDALEDPAVFRCVWRSALGTQCAKLLLKAPQFLNSIRNVADVLVEQGIHLAAVLLRRVPEPQQHPNLIERHVQVSALPDETQPLDMRLRIDAVVAFGAIGSWQEFLTLVEADGLDGGTACLGQFADSHDRTRSKVRA